jgi:hypothetical protein
MSSTLHFDNATRQSSVITATSTPQNSHHRAGVIVGAFLGVAGAILLVALVLFWLLPRHRRRTATAEVQEVGRRSWTPRDILGGHGLAIIANHRSRSIDLTGANKDTESVAPASDETSETKQWNKSTEVLDISVENVPRSPPPQPLPLPEPKPIEPSISTMPALCIHTNVQADLSPQSSHSSSTQAGSSRSPIRPLPTPPTTRRSHRSAKAEEVHRESGHRRLPHRKFSADDVRPYVYVHDSRQSTAHSENSSCCEAAGCEPLEHHNGGMDAWTDFPPPYRESEPIRETIPLASRATV